MSAEYRMSIALDASGASSGVDNVAKAFANLEKYLSSMDRTLTGIEQGLGKTGTVASKASQNLDKSSKSFDKVEKEAKQAGDSIKDAGKDMDGMNGAVTKLNSTLGMLKGAFVGAMAFAGLGSVVQTADAMKTLDGQIKIATGSAEKHAFAMSEIERIAMANNVSLSSVGEMYVSNERALKQLGKSQQEVVKFTEQVTTAMRLGGGSAEAQSAALTQLGQALASGVLRGDEFNSIAEQAPMIMELMADSLNVTTGELRKMAAEGKLTADVVYDAMTSAGATEKLASMASQSSTTISGALENVRTQWDLAVHGLMNSEGGISSIIAGGISLIADGLAKFGDYIPQINEYISGVVSQAKELGTAFLESDAGKAAIDGLKIAFEGLKAGVEGVASVADSVTQFFRENPELAIALASGIGAAAAAFGAFKLIVLGVTAVTTAWAAVTAGAAAALAVLTSPITLTLAAIAALVAIGVYLYRNWDELPAKASEIWNNIKETVSNAWESIKSLFSGDGFSGIWDGIKESASVAWEWIKGIVSGAWENLKSSFTGGGDLLSETWEAIKAGVGEAWDGIKQAVIDKFNEIKQAFLEWVGGQPAPVQEIVTNIISIFTGLVGGIGAVWDLISSGASAAWEGIKSITGGAIDWISSKWDGIKSGASNAWESVKSTASGAFESVKGYASEKLGQAKTTVSNIASDIGSAWDKVKDGAGKAFDNVKSAISDKLSGAKSEAVKAMEGVKSAIASSGVGDAFSKGFDSAKNAVSTAMSGIKSAVTAGITAVKAMIQLNVTGFAIIFNTAFNTIKTVVQTAFGVIKAVAMGDINAVKSVIQNGLSQLAGIARNAISQMVAAFKSAGSQLRNVGGDIIQGLINGLKAKAAAAVSAAREVASSAVSAFKSVFRTASPSRVTREIGEWVSEGLAIGIAKQAPLAEKAAKKAAEAVKKAFDDELANLERSILVNTLKLKGDPNAEFTADVVSGKYGDAKNLDKLYQTKQQALDLEQQVKAMESFDTTIADLRRQIAMIGKDNPITEMWYDFEHKHKYVGYTVEQMQELESQLIALGKAKVNADFADELKKSTDELNKQQFLLNNIGDKYAELRYSLAQKGFDTSQIEHIVSNTQQSDTMAQFRQWDAKNRENALNTDPLAKLQADFDAEMALITSFNEQKLLSEQEYLQRKSDLEAQFDAQSQALKIAGYESQLALASGLAKDLLGESSRGYKAIFAMEKGMAIARVLMDNKVALAKAWASAPFPQNLPAVGTTLVKTGALAAAVNAIRPVIGQAHDGIMSVPKSGTWNLEKGERVLPKHTAKALDDKLDGMGSGGVNITINVASDGSSTTDAQGANQTAKAMADRIKTVVLETLRQERKQGGLLYA